MFDFFRPNHETPSIPEYTQEDLDVAEEELVRAKAEATQAQFGPHNKEGDAYREETTRIRSEAREKVMEIKGALKEEDDGALEEIAA